MSTARRGSTASWQDREDTRPTVANGRRPFVRSAANGRRPFATAIPFLLPYLLLFAVFLLWPLLYGFYLSLHDWHILSQGCALSA